MWYIVHTPTNEFTFGFDTEEEVREYFYGSMTAKEQDVYHLVFEESDG